MELQLHGSHRTVYDAIFQHPIARNLQWRDLRSMLVALTDATDEPNGNLRLSRNGHTLVLHPPIRKDFSDVQELMKIRHFLEQSGAPTAPAAGDGKDLLVVIDHRQARVYSAELHGTVPQRITPYDPHGLGRHLHYVQDDSNGQRKPEQKSFYEAIIKTLEGAQRVLIFGSSTGASSAMDQLLAELERRHKELAKRIVGSIVVNEQHMTEPQLLAKAREFYAVLPQEAAPA